MSEFVITLIFAGLVFPLGFILLERRYASIPNVRVFRRGFGSDVIWYAVQSVVSRTLAPMVVFAILAPASLLFGQSVERFSDGFGPASQLPFLGQVAIAFVLADFFLYWQHRLFHTSFGWPFHAVHHSSEDLDWLSATRMHPVNEIGAQLISASPVLLLGFNPLALLVVVPLIGIYAVFIHSNLRWNFGLLRYVIASPVFHRWHHTTRHEGLNKNFASYLPIWDLLFGTFYLPVDRQPREFGIGGVVPDGFIKQLVYPLLLSSWKDSAGGPIGAQDTKA
jgi:sterol desaturase/sphingolipid hydroxylase (fatty acid hydroxylase superfamily)